MNNYADLGELKTLLGIDDTGSDAQLLRALESASRQLDRKLERHFFSKSEARYFDGASRLWADDLLSVTTLKLDEDGDGTYEATMAATDYHQYPLNGWPKVRLEINPNGDYGSFAQGIGKGIELTGIFGYGDGQSSTPYENRTTLNGALTNSTTSVPVVSGATVEIGENILTDTEQMYVSDIVTNTLTVKRGINGTTAAAHDTAKTVSAYIYPAEITQACLVLAMRAWKRKDSAYQDVVGSPETGQVITSKGIDPDVAEIIKPYMRPRYI